MGVGLAAFIWGLAEATVFFIVPDVLLSFVALRSLRRAFICCLLALAGGALLGTPYKVYAVQAGAAGMGLGAFLLISIPARLSRFILVCLLSAGSGRLLRHGINLRRRQGILCLVWVLFYTLYFSHM